MTPPPGKGLDNPFETPLPDRDLYPDDEVSQVKNPGDAWRKLEKFDRVLNRMIGPIQQIPDIAEKVDGVVERVARVEERLDTTKERVNGLDAQSRRPHDCFQVDNIERVEVAGLSLRKDVEDDTRKIELVSKDVADMKAKQKSVKELRRHDKYYWIGLAASFLTVAGGSIWYMRGVSADIQLESQARAAQFDQVKTVLTKVSEQSNPVPMQQDFIRLEKAVKAANGNETMEEYCSGLSGEAVRTLKRTLPEVDWPRCSRFRVAPP